ncbi:aldo/keto reductase [Umbelopsis sp. PMI_123]|nr:aldo/keto reductase [Umbelopsis sp. PMI_123]
MTHLSLNTQVNLNNGRQIPAVGLGVYRAQPGESTQAAVLEALKLGYRHIDTAHIYQNETDVGAAIARSGIPREEIFVTTKLWDADQGFESAIKACEESLQKLGLDYIDLYLVHSPNPGPQRRKQTWDALQQLVAKDKVKSIGVSNYGIQHLKELLGSNPNIRPVVNQLEIHPWNTREELVNFCLEQNIQIEAYSPLTKGRKLNDADLLKIAAKYDKSPAQILIRWSLQHGYIVLPKSVTPERIASNVAVFDFDLSDSDMKTLDEKDEYLLTGWDPTVVP